MIALTVEAAGAVVATSAGATWARLGQALIIVEAGLVVLGEAWGTAAGEGADGVDTEELAVMLPGGALVKVSADPAVLLQPVATGAGTQEAAFSVFAEEGARWGGLAAFIHIQAGCGSGVRCIPGLAVAAEGAQAIDALAVGAQVGKHMALIHILTVGGIARAVGAQLPVGGCARQGAELAAGTPGTATPTAALSPGGHLAAAGRSLACGLQHLGEAGPLAGVVALGEAGAGLEALVTVTLEAALGVDAAAVGTEAGLGAAFIVICAALPGAQLGPCAGGADAGEGANEVLAQHAPGMAVLLAICTLVHISAHGPILS